jgi:putative membrane protein
MDQQPSHEELIMWSRLFARATAGAVLLGFAFALHAQSSSKQAAVANATDSMFMIQAKASGMAEIRMGQLALQETSNIKVKGLAQRIVEDHANANRKLGALAQDKQVTLPDSSSNDAQATVASMSSLDGGKFDRAWAAAMVSDHQKAITLFTNEIEKARDPQVRAFAQATLPTLKAHLEMAQRLQSQLK